MKRIAIKWAFIAAVAVAVAILAAGWTLHHLNNRGMETTAGTDCTTCLSVKGPSTAPVLHPGAPASLLPVTFTNTTSVAIRLTQLTVTFTNSFPTGCPVSNFQVGDSSPGAAVSLPGSTTTVITYATPQSIAAGSTWSDTATLSMPDTRSSQDGCQGQPLTMSYTGTAQYTVLTSTSLTEAANAGSDSAVLTASVAADMSQGGQTPGPGDGSVTFYSCSDNSSAASCTTSLGTAQLSSPGVATLSIPAGSVGNYNLEAVYSPSDPTNFVGSTSSIVTSTLTGCVAAQTSGATSVLRTGQTYTGNFTVASGNSLWLDGGTINGNLTVQAGGQLAATGGTVNGNIQSSGGPIAMSGITVAGSVQQQNGGLSLGPATSVKGNVQATGGGPFCSQGTSDAKGQVQVRGNLTVQSLGSTTTSSVCSTTVGNNLQWQYNSSPGLIGSCGGNTVLGNLIVQYNSGSVAIGAAGAGNNTTGNTIVSNNTGGGTMTGNSSGGNCLLSADKPGVVGASNTTGKGQNQCNTTSAGA